MRGAAAVVAAAARDRLRQALPPLPARKLNQGYSSARHQSAKRRIPSCIVTFGA